MALLVMGLVIWAVPSPGRYVFVAVIGIAGAIAFLRIGFRESNRNREAEKSAGVIKEE